MRLRVLIPRMHVYRFEIILPLQFPTAQAVFIIGTDILMFGNQAYQIFKYPHRHLLLPLYFHCITLSVVNEYVWNRILYRKFVVFYNFVPYIQYNANWNIKLGRS